VVGQCQQWWNITRKTEEIQQFIAPFLPRDALRISAELVAVGCCPSVRPSVTGVFYQTAKDIVECFSHPGIHIIVVSWGPLVLPNSKGNALYGALNRGGWENTVFGQYLKTRQCYGYCGTSIGSHRCPMSSMTLSDLERRDTRGSVYPADL